MLSPVNFLPYHLFIGFAVPYTAFSLKDKVKEKCTLSSPQKGTERFNRIQVNIVSNKVSSDHMCSSEIAGKRNSFQRQWQTEK